MDPESEARELRALVALLERERTTLAASLAAAEDAVEAERERAADAVEAALERRREDCEAFADSPTLRLDDDTDAADAAELELLRQQVDEAGVVVTDLEARLAHAEEGEAHLMRALDDKTAAHTAKVASLAARLTTAEMENTRLRAEVAAAAAAAAAAAPPPRLAEVSRAKGEAEAAVVLLQAELAEMRLLQADAACASGAGGSSAGDEDEVGLEAEERCRVPRRARSESGGGGGGGVDAVVSAAAADPAIPAGSLAELEEEGLVALGNQYDSRVRHLTALRCDVQRALHARVPGRYPHPDAVAAAAAATAAAATVAAEQEQGAEKANEGGEHDDAAAADRPTPSLDGQWLELAHWIRSRFGQRTSLKELRAYMERFTPKRLRVPTPAAAAAGAAGGAAPYTLSSSLSSSSFAASAAPFGGGGGGGGGGDSPPSGRQPWRHPSASASAAGTPLPPLLSDRDTFERAFHEARQKGRSLYDADRARVAYEAEAGSGGVGGASSSLSSGHVARSSASAAALSSAGLAALSSSPQRVWRPQR